MVPALKFLVLKTGEYNLWSMRMEQYLTFTDHALWEVIVNGDSVSPVASASAGAEGHIPLKTAKQKLTRKNEVKAKTTLMLAILDEHLLKFHACKDANSNEIVNTAHSVSAASSKDQASTASYADDVVTKVKCYNCHRIGHFTREYRAPKNQGNRNRDAPRRNAPEDTSTINALIVQDGIVLPPYTGNYMPPRADLSFAGSSAPLIEEKELDIKDENVFKPKEVKKTVKPSFEKIEFVNARNTTVEMKAKLKNLGSSVRVLGGKITGPKEIRPFWDNTARVNHQSKLTHPHPKRNFIPAAVSTKSRQVPVNAAKQSSHRAASSVTAARRVNTVASRPNVNDALPTTYSYFKAHSPARRPFNKKSAAKTNNFN
nr:ribonuclease H-like domain-containing protein [Tanacetum cinerariifolium]